MHTKTTFIKINADHVYMKSIKENFQMLENDFSMNLLQVGEAVFKEVLHSAIVGSERITLTKAIEFNSYSQDGVVNLYTFYFSQASQDTFTYIRDTIETGTSHE